MTAYSFVEGYKFSCTVIRKSDEQSFSAKAIDSILSKSLPKTVLFKR